MLSVTIGMTADGKLLVVDIKDGDEGYNFAAPIHELEAMADNLKAACEQARAHPAFRGETKQ